MKRSDSIAIILAFNEEKNIEKVVDDFYPYFSKLIIVDDGSTDSTSSILQKLNYSDIVLIKNEKNLGIGGAFKKGSLKAELDIKDDLWFFECHFKEDPVMPGCLGLDAMWQLVGFYLGWLGNPGKGRALGVSTVKFTGEVLQNVKNVRYEIDMKKIMAPGGTTVGLANGLVFADDKKIYSAESLKVGLFK